MTPQEAVWIVEHVAGGFRYESDERRALDVLIDHARATAAPEIDDLLDLRAWVASVHGVGEYGTALSHVLAEIDRRLAPTSPIAVGDTVKSAAELGRLPVGAVLRDAGEHVWVIAEGRVMFPVEDLNEISYPLRVIDLPEVTS